jgi:Uma2 family endonuclease
MRNDALTPADDVLDACNFEPRPYRWTVEAYVQACEAGLFLETRVQLLDGEIIEMPAQKNWHAIGLDQTHDALRSAFGPNHWVRAQMSLDLSPWSMPEPDLLVVPGARHSYAGMPIPTGGLLVVEVSETTLWYDRNRKSHIYAAGGLQEYWILNVIDHQLEVYRDPVADSAAWLGHRYQTRTDLVAGDIVTPLALPGASIAVVDLLP